MATFAPVTALDYAKDRTDSIRPQVPVELGEFNHQYTSDFGQYRMCMHDLDRIDTVGGPTYYIRAELAACVWETVRMKVRYILAAAHNWRGDVNTEPLPTDLPKEKCDELSMGMPPIPAGRHLHFNFLKLHDKPEVLFARVESWQQIGHQLTAWIDKAKERTDRIEYTTWHWPEEPSEPVPYGERENWTLDDQEDPHEWTVYEVCGWASRKRLRPAHSQAQESRRHGADDGNTVAEECHAAAPADTGDAPDEEASGSESAISENIRSNCTHPCLTSLKPPTCADKQLIKWVPPISQIFERLYAIGVPPHTLQSHYITSPPPTPTPSHDPKYLTSQNSFGPSSNRAECSEGSDYDSLSL